MMDVMCLELLPGKKMKLSRCEHCKIMILRCGNTVDARLRLISRLPVPWLYTVARRCMRWFCHGALVLMLTMSCILLR